MSPLYSIGAQQTAHRTAAVLAAIAAIASLSASARGTSRARPTANDDTREVRRQLEALYQRHADAFARHDAPAIMALRASDFHTITPDGTVRDRAAMETYPIGFLNGVRKWNRQSVTIDGLRVVGDTAFAIVTQHLDRMALPQDNSVHHVETWVTQRETWVRRNGQWLMWRVDQLRNQRRMIDGRPG